MEIEIFTCTPFHITNEKYNFTQQNTHPESDDQCSPSFPQVTIPAPDASVNLTAKSGKLLTNLP